MARRRANAGFTLLELLVATAVLAVLGTSVVVILRGGIKTWRRGELRRESFEVAQAVIGQMSDDLQNATVDADTSTGGKAEAVFFGAVENGRCYLTLVRTIRGESENTITGHAGSQIGADARIDYRDDMKKALDNRLKATGGLMEVAYAMGEPGGPDAEVLYRGIRSPIGDRTSFFTTPKFYRAPLPGMPEPAKKDQAPEGVALLRAFATKVIHFEVLYATPYTTTWSLDEPPRRSLTQPSGPLIDWDSTRSVPKMRRVGNSNKLEIVPPNPKLFSTYVDKGSRSNTADDILPPRVKVTIVVREGDAAESSTTLMEDVNDRVLEMRVAEPERCSSGGFVYVDDEWLAIDDVVGPKLKLKARGARRTNGAAHKTGAEVVIGRTFESVITLPAAREDWEDK